MAQNIQSEEITGIIKECQQGSHEAFRRLVEKYQEAAYRIAYRILNDADGAKDISQEAFIKIFYSIRRFKLAKSFYTWLYYIVVRLCIDQLRTRKVRGSVTRQDIRDSATKSPDELIILDEERRTIQTIMEELPPKYRAVLVLRDIEGLPSQEVAQIMKCSDGTVRWTLCEARKSFKEAWRKRQKES